MRRCGFRAMQDWAEGLAVVRRIGWLGRVTRLIEIAKPRLREVAAVG